MILVFSIFLYVSALHDSIIINAGRTLDHLDHSLRFVLRTLVTLSIAVITHGFNTLAVVLLSLFLASVWWFVFDLVLNIMIDRKPFAVGSTAMLDKIFKKSPYIQFVLKGILLLITGFAYNQFV